MARIEASAPAAGVGVGAEAAGSRLAALLERLRPGVIAAFTRYRIPPADAEDLLQEVLLALLLKQQEVRCPEGWFMTVLRRRCLLYLRRRRRRAAAPLPEETAGPPGAGGEPQQAAWERRHDLGAALEALPAAWRGVVVDCYFLDLEGDEVARRNGYAPASVRKVKSRALKALARHLGGAGDGRG